MLLFFLLLLHGPVKTVQVQHYDIIQKFGADNYLYTGKEITQYDPSGKLMEYSHFNGSLRDLYVKNTYQPTGEIFVSDTLQTRYHHIAHFVYDTAGLLTRHSVYEYNGDLISKTIYEYKHDRQPIRAITYGEDGKPSYTTSWQYEYDDAHRLTARYTHTAEHTVLVDIEDDSKETYDTLGNMVGGYFTLSGEDTREYLYNDHHNIIEDKNKRQTYTYTYDTLGNITQQNTYAELFGKPTLIHCAKYTYLYHTQPPKKPHTKK